jgi:hypothetical protein
MIERRPITAATTDKPTVSSTNGSGAAAEVNLTSPLPDRLAELERRISAALADAGVRAATLANLLQQVEWALPLAEDFARSEQQTALDPLAIPDSREARQRSEDAIFACNRLKTLQPRLRARHLQVYQQEAVQTYLAKLADFAPESDALARELHATYATATSKLLDVFARVKSFEQRARSALGDPPANCAVLARLDTRVLDKTVLPSWPNPDTNVWPPPSNFAATFAASMIVPSAGPYWADEQVRARIAAEQVQERERMARHYATQAAEQLERENRTLRENWEASQRRE